MENSMEVSQKMKNRITIWSSNATPGHIPKQNSNTKNTCTSMFIAALFTITKTCKEIFINKWLDKEDMVHTYNGILLSHKKEQNNVICKNMDATYCTMWCKPERERQIPYDITYMWDLKYDTNEPICETETDSQNSSTDLLFPRERVLGEGMDWEVGISRCKLLYIKTG